MRTWYSVFALVCVLGFQDALGSDATSGVSKGDTFEQVISKLGAPKGQVKGGKRTTYYYDRGTVDFMAGRVERAFLITAQDAKEKIAEREKAEEAMRVQAEAEHERLMAAGRAQLEKVLGDKVFSASSPAIRLAFWTDFQKQYPGVDVSAPIAEAQKGREPVKSESAGVKELVTLNTRAAEIDTRFKQLDEDYAVSLANWKRTEIDQDRAQLTDELNTIKAHLAELLK